MSDEYDLKRAGFFDEKDLLEFVASENEKGRKVTTIAITPKQAFNLLPNQKNRKKHHNPLIAYWNTPSLEGLESIHGINVEVEL